MNGKIRIWIIGVVTILSSAFSLSAQPVETKAEVRVEATWIEIPTEELSKYNLNFSQKKDSGIVLPEGVKVVGSEFSTGVVSRAILKELKKNENAKVCSVPGIITIDGFEGAFAVTKTVHYMKKVKDDLYQLKEMETGISFKVTPVVKPEGMIALNDLNFQISALVKHTSLPDAPSLKIGQPIIDVRSSQTSIIVKDGQIAVVGGLMQGKEKEGMSFLFFLTAKKIREVATSGKIRKVILRERGEK